MVVIAKAPGTASPGTGDVTEAELAAAIAAHDADTTVVHGIADTSLLETDAGAAAKVAAEAVLARNADNLSSGTVADNRIASTIARDSEVSSAVASEAAARDAAINAAINALIGGAPGTLDTLDELAAAFGDDANFVTTVTNALAGKQPIDADLTAIGGLDSSTAGAIASDGSGWIKKTYAQLKTALGLVKGDVGLGNVDNTADSVKTFTEAQTTNLVADLAALQTQAAVQAAQLAAHLAADAGFYVGQGLVYSPNATPTKLDSTAGTGLIGPAEVRPAAQTAISTTIASLANATNPKWVAVEVDASGVTQFNQGTAAAAPALPTFTASRIPVYLIYVPANATNVDTLLTTDNGLAKLYDIRIIKGGPGPTGWQYDQNTWVFASATTFTIAGIDATGYLPIGTKLSYNDGAVDYATVKTVTFSTDTTVTVITNSDYSIANATLARPRFSYSDSPQGFPPSFTFAPTLTGYSADPTGLAYHYSVSGGWCEIVGRDTTNGTSNATSVTVATPINARTLTNGVWQGFCRYSDNGSAIVATPGLATVVSAGTVVAFGTNLTAVAGFTASGGKRIVSFSIRYPIA